MSCTCRSADSSSSLVYGLLFRRCVWRLARLLSGHFFWYRLASSLSYRLAGPDRTRTWSISIRRDSLGLDAAALVWQFDQPRCGGLLHGDSASRFMQHVPVTTLGLGNTIGSAPASNLNFWRGRRLVLGDPLRLGPRYILRILCAAQLAVIRNVTRDPRGGGSVPCSIRTGADAGCSSASSIVDLPFPGRGGPLWTRLKGWSNRHRLVCTRVTLGAAVFIGFADGADYTVRRCSTCSLDHVPDRLAPKGLSRTCSRWCCGMALRATRWYRGDVFHRLPSLFARVCAVVTP